MAAIFNDGSVPYGSMVATVNGVGYIAESMTFTQPTTFIERRNELNEPSGGVTIEDFTTGSGVWQLATTGTTVPTMGTASTFPYTPQGGSAGVYYLTEVGLPLAQGETKKVNVSFRKKVN